MKVLAIMGSYRKNGVINMVTQKALDGAASKGCEIETVCLIDKNIKYCKACRNCKKDPELDMGICVQNDDMLELLRKFREADRYVMGTPVYCENASAVMKAFTERCFPLSRLSPEGFPESRRQDDRKKRGVIIVSMGAPLEVGRHLAEATAMPMEGILTLEIEKDTFIPQDNGTIEKIYIGMVSPHSPVWPDMELTLRTAFEAGVRLSQ